MPPASTSKKPLKAQPKSSARRSKEDREAIEKAETEALEARKKHSAAEDAAELKRRNEKYGLTAELRGRGGGRASARGGRGTFMGQTSRRTVPEQHAEPPPSAPAAPAARGQRGQGQGQRGSGGRSTGRGDANVAVKEEEEEEPEQPPVPKAPKKQDPDMAARDSVDLTHEDPNVAGPAYNVERLNISDDSDDDAVQLGPPEDPDAAHKRALERRFLPVRMKRSEHVEHSFAVNTQSSAATAAGIKPEPKEDDDIVMLDEGGESSPAPKRRKGKVSARDVTEEREHRSSTSPRKPRTKAPIIDLTRHADDREKHQHEVESEAMRTELRSVHPHDPRAAAPLPGKAARRDPEPDPRANKLYLFQLPPIMSPLVPAGTKIKKEDEDETADDAPTNPADDMLDPEEEEVVKEEDEDAAEANEQVSDTYARQYQPGVVGKLRVHRSGRVTLDWGGHVMEVGMGIDASFLQTAMIVETDAGKGSGALAGVDETGRDGQGDGAAAAEKVKQDPDRGAAGQMGGEAISLGPIHGKFVVKPDLNWLLGPSDDEDDDDRDDGAEGQDAQVR